MITKKINNETIYFIADPMNGYSSILQSNGLLKKDGSPYKTVTLDLSTSYSFGRYRFPAIKFTNKTDVSYIIPDSFTVRNSNDVDDMTTIMGAYGTDSVMSVSNRYVKCDFRANGNTIRNSEMIQISFSGDEQISKKAEQLLSRLGVDNGGLVAPLIDKFVNITRIVRMNTDRLTGYANLAQYLMMMKQPTNDLYSDGKNAVKYILNIESTDIGIRLVSYDDQPILEPIGFSINVNNTTPTPYILITTKPITLGKRVPSQIVRYGGRAFFITPLVFNSDKILKGLSGGIDLLK